MTEKELHKLRRQDLLELLLTQGQQKEELQAALEQTSAELETSQTTTERLKARLNEKDELIEKLKDRLNQKDANIENLENIIEIMQESRRIELEKAGSIAMAALQLNGVFEAAQKAAEQYLENIRELVREKYGDLADQAALPEVLPESPAQAKPEPERQGLIAALGQGYGSLAEYFTRKTR